MQFSDKYPFLTKYFETALKNQSRALSHSILFFGNDVQTSYDLAFEVARRLNCTNGGAQECECLNCNWIREHRHPAVLVYSKTDNKLPDDTSKTVISMKQALAVRAVLAATSEYHRVFIFCDRDEQGNVQGLNRLNFQEEASNALLKIIEEPPPNTTFFFLAREKEDIIETIVSRSQSFFVPSKKAETYDFSITESILKNFFELKKAQYPELARDLIDLTKTEGVQNVLQSAQNFFLSLLKSNSDNCLLEEKFIKNIQTIETAKKQIKLGMLTQNVFENMCIDILSNVV